MDENLTMKYFKLIRKIEEEAKWAKEGLKADNLDEASENFYKGTLYACEMILDK